MTEKKEKVTMKKLMVILSLLVLISCNSNTSPFKNKQHETCLELAALICAKASTCSETVLYRNCFNDLSTMKCDENSIELINTCILQFSNIPCDGHVPDSCLQLK